MFFLLFAIQLILLSAILLTTYMLDNKFKNIEMSLEKYASPRAYKTQSQVDFIETVIRKYKECIETIGFDTNLENIIQATLYKEQIGRFSLIAVKNIAVKSSRMMWGLVFFEVFVAYIYQISHETIPLLVISSTLLMTIIIELFKHVKNIEDQHEVIIMLVQDYILNLYPIELQNNLVNKEVVRLRTRVNELEKQIKEEGLFQSVINEYREKQNISDEELTMQDIVKLIGIFQ